MHGPAAVGWLLVAVCALAGAVCCARAWHLRGRAREAAAAEAAMGGAMALMAFPGGPLPPLGYVAVFAALAGWALTLLVRGAGHQLHHVTEAGAMGYLAAVMATGQHSGPALVGGALALYFAAHALRTGARGLVPAPVTAAGPAVPWPAFPGVTHGCRLALSLAMCPMLVL
ncbi:DUF5134 domain-containing protein [Streptomyces sp. JJ66]|uniref:DUF5134 domain-containing protein n=1 Tax=Streptomyces sp. JJ66 TaxID=2803843 RepID=UPI001C55CD4F|nr:DUF5134 domain-containing protein [Streptomyces sp. JJ66]MBW1602083.1 DUF5134 domain-containing protein [Streptomyces sp. JJ66]